MYPENYRYTKEHEWVHVEGDTGTIGITDHAQQNWATSSTWTCPRPGRYGREGQDARLGRIGQGGQRHFFTGFR